MFFVGKSVHMVGSCIEHRSIGINYCVSIKLIRINLLFVPDLSVFFQLIKNLVDINVRFQHLRTDL